MRYILDTYQYVDDKSGYFLKKEEYDEIFGLLVNRRELKDFQKHHGQQLIDDAEKNPFPRQLMEYKQFKDFMEEAQKWELQTTEFIRLY
jgi:hypothetical protein